MAEYSPFQDFLLSVSRDTDARRSYLENPAAVMREAGLSESQIVAVLSQDQEAIQAEVGGESEASIRVIVTIIVTVQI